MTGVIAIPGAIGLLHPALDREATGEPSGTAGEASTTPAPAGTRLDA
jgi:hypothetical protein